MPEFYVLRRYGIAEPIDAERAQRLYIDAQADPHCGLKGDLEAGFEFWTTSDGVQLVRCTVKPMGEGQQ